MFKRWLIAVSILFVLSAGYTAWLHTQLPAIYDEYNQLFDWCELNIGIADDQEYRSTCGYLGDPGFSELRSTINRQNRLLEARDAAALTALAILGVIVLSLIGRWIYSGA